MLFKRDRLHDFWVSKKIKNESFVIGYEECCRDTFKQAKKKGIITILDLAQIHYKEIETISKDFPVFSEIYKNKNLRNKINSIKREEIELADYIMCLSTFAKESLIKYGYPSHRIFVVNLGFDPLKFKPKKTYSQTGKLKIVYAGTITKRKGIDLLLKLNSELSDLIELTFIGPMADAADIFKKEGNYKWYPYLDHDELNKVFNEQDVFIFPSYLDSWAMVVIEAMACGLPVVISANTGAKDSIQKNEGFIVEPGNYQSLKEKVLYLHSNRSICEAMGRQAHIQAQKYTWAAYQIQVQEVLKKIGNLRFY